MMLPIWSAIFRKVSAVTWSPFKYPHSGHSNFTVEASWSEIVAFVEYPFTYVKVAKITLGDDPY